MKRQNQCGAGMAATLRMRLPAGASPGAPAAEVDDYAIKAARAAAPGCDERAGRLECRWQREQLPDGIRELVLDDQRLRNDICWSVFDC